MTNFIETALQPGWDRPVRLATLQGLRWLAIAGQAIGVIFVRFGLGFPLPLEACLGLIALSALLNLYLTVKAEAGKGSSRRDAELQLAYDILQLGCLLALTGGLQNPFSLLLLAPVSVSASILPQRSTIRLAILVVVLATILSMWHLPLPWSPNQRIVFDRIYVVGIWVSLLCGLVFITAYISRVAHEARQLADALAATELTLSRHERLNALDGLAAAAAHELGTPLSTIALAAREMRDDIPPGSLAEDVDLIISQAARCRAILAKLRNLGADDGDPFAVLLLEELIAEAAQPHEDLGKDIRIKTIGDGGPEPEVKRSVGLLYGLGNLIENATAFADKTVEVTVRWTPKTVIVTIADDGPGFPIEVMTRLGEPYLTHRKSGHDAESGGGLGLGIFIAKTLLERTGARLAFANVDGHAEVRISWPRDAVDTGLSPFESAKKTPISVP
jgi:two-component system, sensor histidine kinase RegB